MNPSRVIFLLMFCPLIIFASEQPRKPADSKKGNETANQAAAPKYALFGRLGARLRVPIAQPAALRLRASAAAFKPQQSAAQSAAGAGAGQASLNNQALNTASTAQSANPSRLKANALAYDPTKATAKHDLKASNEGQNQQQSHQSAPQDFLTPAQRLFLQQHDAKMAAQSSSSRAARTAATAAHGSSSTHHSSSAAARQIEFEDYGTDYKVIHEQTAFHQEHSLAASGLVAGQWFDVQQFNDQLMNRAGSAASAAGVPSLYPPQYHQPFPLTVAQEPPLVQLVPMPKRTYNRQADFAGAGAAGVALSNTQLYTHQYPQPATRQQPAMHYELAERVWTYDQNFYNALAILNALGSDARVHANDQNKTAIKGEQNIPGLKQLIFNFLKVNDWHNIAVYREPRHYQVLPALSYRDGTVHLTAHPTRYAFNFDNSSRNYTSKWPLRSQPRDAIRTYSYNNTYLALAATNGVHIIDQETNIEQTIEGQNPFSLHRFCNNLAIAQPDGVIRFFSIKTQRDQIEHTLHFNFPTKKRIQSMAFIANDMIAVTTTDKKLIVWQTCSDEKNQVYAMNKIAEAATDDHIEKITPCFNHNSNEVVFATSSKTLKKADRPLDGHRYYCQTWRIEKKEKKYSLNASNQIHSDLSYYRALAWINHAGKQQPWLARIRLKREPGSPWSTELVLLNRKNGSQHVVNLNAIHGIGNQPLHVHDLLHMPHRNVLVMASNEGLNNFKTLRVLKTTGDMLSEDLHKKKMASQNQTAAANSKK